MTCPFPWCFPGMAFALLANLPPVNGLYSSFFPLVTYLFLGGIHQMVPGKSLQSNCLHRAVKYWLAILGVSQNRDVWVCLVHQGFTGFLILAAWQDLTPVNYCRILPWGCLQ